jgi:hypothetical protein
MIAVQLHDRDAAARLVDALLVASGAVPAPTDPAERQDFLILANALGDGLDLLPVPTQSQT